MSEPKRTRLLFFGFAEEMSRGPCSRVIKDGSPEEGRSSVEDWALVHKAPGGKLTIENDKSKDPGAGRGALFGGGRACSRPRCPDRSARRRSPGAAIGAVAAAIKDSGFKNDDIEAVSRFMADGRTRIMLATPLAEADTVGTRSSPRTPSSRPRPEAPRGHRPGPRLRHRRSRSTGARRRHNAAGDKRPPRPPARVDHAEAGRRARGTRRRRWSVAAPRRRRLDDPRPQRAPRPRRAGPRRRGSGTAPGPRGGGGPPPQPARLRPRGGDAGPPEARRAAARIAALLDAGALPDGTPLPPLPLRVDLVALDVDAAGSRASAITGGSGPSGRPVLHSRPPRIGRDDTHARAGTTPARSPHADHQPDRDGAQDRPSAPSQGPRRGSAEDQPQEVTPVPTVSMRQLLEAGVHFGHQTRRWNPKMKPFIFAERNGIHIIDLAQTVKRLDGARVRHRDRRPRRLRALRRHEEAGAGARDAGGDPRRPALRHKRWLGGMLTNFVTIKKRIGLLDQLEARQLAGDFDRLPKKEAAPADRGAQQAPGHARRHPQDEAPARRDLHRRPAPRADRGDRGEQARDPGGGHGRHERRPR